MLCLHRSKTRFLATVENNSISIQAEDEDLLLLGFQFIFDFILSFNGSALFCTHVFIECPCKPFVFTLEGNTSQLFKCVVVCSFVFQIFLNKNLLVYVVLWSGMVRKKQWRERGAWGRCDWGLLAGSFSSSPSAGPAPLSHKDRVSPPLLSTLSSSRSFPGVLTGKYFSLTLTSRASQANLMQAVGA